ALVAPEMPGLKLAIAWAVPLVFHAALLRSRAPVALAAGACAALAAAALDAGLAAALVLPGVAAALVLAARDACWSARDLGALGAYRARHAPVATAHALLVAAAAAAAIALALVDTGDEPGRALTSAALHAPLLVA